MATSTFDLTFDPTLFVNYLNGALPSQRQAPIIADQPWFQKASDARGILGMAARVLTADGGAHHIKGALTRMTYGAERSGVSGVCAMGAIFLCTEGMEDMSVQSAPEYVHGVVNMIARELVRMGCRYDDSVSSAQHVAGVNDTVGAAPVVIAMERAMARIDAGEPLDPDNCVRAKGPAPTITFKELGLTVDLMFDEAAPVEEVAKGKEWTLLNEAAEAPSHVVIDFPSWGAATVAKKHAAAYDTLKAAA